jgi:hypothetical protein
MQRNLAFDHVALALANRRHVYGNRLCHRAESGAMLRQMRDPGAPDLVLAGHAGDVGTRPSDPAALHDGCPAPRLRHMPGQQLAAPSAADDDDVELLWL